MSFTIDRALSSLRAAAGAMSSASASAAVSCKATAGGAATAVTIALPSGDLGGSTVRGSC